MLTAGNDPMGQAIDDFFHKREMHELMVLSDITEPDVIPVEYLFRTFDNMPEIEKRALQECRGSILDVGAAAGTHSLWLQDKGSDVTAIDISQQAVSVLNHRGVNKSYCVDFFDFFPTLKYDTLLFLMNGIGIAGTTNRLPDFFATCNSLLANGGQILLDSSDLIYMYDEDEELDQEKYYGEVEYVLKYGELESEPFPWLFIDFARLQAAAKEHGFACEKVMDGDHFDYIARLTRKAD